MSTLSMSDYLVQPPDYPGFRMFSRLSSVFRGWNAVRVPHRAQYFPSSEGFCFNLYTPCGRVPLTLVRGLWPGRRGGLCRCVGDRFGVLASGPAACCGLGLCGSSVRFLSGWAWLANTCSWLWDAGTT